MIADRDVRNDENTHWCDETVTGVCDYRQRR